MSKKLFSSNDIEILSNATSYLSLVLVSKTS